MHSCAEVHPRERSIDLADFDYPLPAEQIAQQPAARRDGARLMVLGRRAGGLEHSAVADLTGHLRAGDVLVLNDTRVRPARLRVRTESGGSAELLVVTGLGAGLWQCLGKPAKRLGAGTVLSMPDGTSATVDAALGGGRYAVRFAAADVGELLERCGEVPLPPYVKRPGGPSALDRERYQTVFARVPGAVAAPTAGLHFSAELLARLAAAGVETEYVTLHVGPGTFLPIRHGDVRRHRMDAEWARIPAPVQRRIGRARDEGRRVIAVGTTTVRALESAAGRSAEEAEAGFWADAFIRPGFRFRVADGLFTNFHLPKSTLLMLVSAFAGRERVLGAYASAVREGYRFYSYGDAMLILE
jgi:S-adenosylmethionine:tRNA ribosyltransferase-isomerase